MLVNHSIVSSQKPSSFQYLTSTGNSITHCRVKLLPFLFVLFTSQQYGVIAQLFTNKRYFSPGNLSGLCKILLNFTFHASGSLSSCFFCLARWWQQQPKDPPTFQGTHTETMSRLMDELEAKGATFLYSSFLISENLALTNFGCVLLVASSYYINREGQWNIF